MIQLYAQPYDTEASGFYFSKTSEFAMSSLSNRKSSGEIVEEYEIQFIDGEAIDCQLAKAWHLSQSNFARFLEIVDDWDDHEKRLFIIAVGECGYDFDVGTVDASDFDVDIYEVESLTDLAEQFVDEGLFGPIPEALQHYIDYDTIARDLSVDYSMTEIAGERLAYACR